MALHCRHPKLASVEDIDDSCSKNSAFQSGASLSSTRVFDERLICKKLRRHNRHKSQQRFDTQRTGGSVSNCEFGMVIERTGPLICRSLWSEMLENRKFYFPNTTNCQSRRPESTLPRRAGMRFAGGSGGLGRRGHYGQAIIVCR